MNNEQHLPSAKKYQIKEIILIIIFLLILLRVFFHVTYLFRNVNYNRYHIVGVEQEKDLDMIYIGGSAAFVYWQPLLAWHDRGIASYVMGTNSIGAENLKPYIRYARKYHDPELFVIDLRPFQYYSDEPEGTALRHGSDSMDILSLPRYQLIWNFLKYRDTEPSFISLIFDIAKYHSNTGNLSDPAAWRLINNNGTAQNKGWEWINYSFNKYLGEPEFMTEERADLPENGKKLLVDLLDYLKNEKIKAVFVVCPYWIKTEDQMKYNTMKDIIESYDFGYINTNEYFREMDINFVTDFYNENHVNVLGSHKFTQFMAAYFQNNYDLPDHRSEEKFRSWDEAYERFLQEKTEFLPNVINRIMRENRSRKDDIPGVKILDITGEDIVLQNASLVLEDRYPAVLCRGSLAREEDHDEDSLGAYLYNTSYIGFKTEAADLSEYRYLTFNGKKITDHGQPSVFVYDGNGNIAASLVKSYSDLDNEWHQYTILLPENITEASIIFNGGYVDRMGSSDSEFVFRDIIFY